MDPLAEALPSPHLLTFLQPIPHRLSQGGMPVEVNHQHPSYTNEAARLARLQELKKACAAKLQTMRNHEKVA